MSDGSQIKETDIYKINNSDISVQRETTWENILEYFDLYIRPYTPYKDEPTYKAMISFIIKYYANLVYNEQPEIFKDMFEKQTIRNDIIDLLLVSIGLPESLVRSITTASKIIILKSFSDFERYQGTVKFFRSLGGSFTDTVSFYELYIDYDDSYINSFGEYIIHFDKDNIYPGSYFLVPSTTTNYYVWFNYNDSSINPQLEGKTGIEIKYDDDSTTASISQDISLKLNETREFYADVNSTDIIHFQLSEHGAAAGNPSSGTTKINIRTITEAKGQGSWILRPRPIFVHPKMTQLKETFSYRAAYNKIPTLLVPEEQLEELRQAEEIILPTKSNIILMDYTYILDATALNTLLFTILMENIGDMDFQLYLTNSDGTTAITYNTAVYTWFYLVAKYYGVTMEGVAAAHHIVMGTNKDVEYQIDMIETIQKEYDNIQTRSQLMEFYDKYYVRQFGRQHYEVEKPTLETMSNTLKRMDASFWQYIETRLAEAEDQKQDLRFLLDEIYASMVVSFSSLGKNDPLYKYSPIILQFITQITTNIKNTDSYKIMYNLKPFHTELLDLANDKIVIDDKFNSLLFDSDIDFLYNLALADLLHMSDEALFSFTPGHGGDALSLNSCAIPNTRLIYTEEMFNNAYRDLADLLFVKTVINFIPISDGAEFLFSPEQNENLIGIIDGITPKGEYIQKTIPWITERLIMKIMETFKTKYSMLSKTEFHFGPPKKSDEIQLNDQFLMRRAEFNLLSENNTKDESFSNMRTAILDDNPYMSDEESFSYEMKDKLSIFSNIKNTCSFLNKSNITLNDSIQIRHKRS